MGMKEIIIGDKWLKISDESFEGFVMIIEAEEKEKRIWQPLRTVVGTKEFMEIRT